VTGAADLERRYRRLLAWYPEPFRSRREDEMLAVLMAGARPGQRWPGLAESADVIWSALGMRLRALRSGPAHRELADAMAVFSVVAPLFLLAVTLLEVALPYRGSVHPRFHVGPAFLGRVYQIGGLSLLSHSGFRVALGGQVLIAILAVLGLRRTTLIAVVASAGYWIVAHYALPDPLLLLSTSVYILEAAALIASPGPRRGRHLVNWGHGVLGLVLLLTAAAVQFSTLWYDAMSPPFRWFVTNSFTTAFGVISIVLAVIAAGLAVAWKLNRYFLLLLTAMLYPYGLQLIPVSSSSSDLIGSPTPAHLALLFLPPLLVASWAVLTAVPPRRRRFPAAAPSPE
jgi:hypothetical protein